MVAPGQGVAPRNPTPSRTLQDLARYTGTLWTLPNIMTFARIVMVPLFFWLFTLPADG